MFMKLVELKMQWMKPSLWRVNMRKTKCMVIRVEGQDLFADKGIIKHVNEYKHLEVNFIYDG